MHLLIDIGNSSLKWTSLSKGTLGASQKFGYTREELAVQLDTQWRKITKPKHILVANVAGQDVSDILQQWTQQRWNIAPDFITAEPEAHGVINAYINPERLGTDRWLAIIAAHHNYEGNVIVLDCGTALTIDAISNEGKHLGGLIIPGLTLMRQSLVSGTDGIQLRTTLPGEVSLLACDTEGAVMGGTLYAMVAIIDRIIHDLEHHFSEKATLILTGGDATTLLPLLAHRYNYQPDLVLHGLAIVAKSRQ